MKRLLDETALSEWIHVKPAACGQARRRAASKDRLEAEQFATRARAGARPEPGTGHRAPGTGHRAPGREWTLRSGADDEYCPRPVATPLTLVSIDPRGCASALPEPYRPPRLAGHRSQTRRGLLRFLSPRERQHLLAARRTASSCLPPAGAAGQSRPASDSARSSRREPAPPTVSSAPPLLRT
jgi:hypothetical protein